MDKFLIYLLLILLLGLFIFPKKADAHPGKTASDGCHYCRTNCDSWGVPWNARHCHGEGITSSENPSGLTNTQEKEILDHLNSPEGRIESDKTFRELIKPSPYSNVVSPSKRKINDSNDEELIKTALIIGGLGASVYFFSKK